MKYFVVVSETLAFLAKLVTDVKSYHFLRENVCVIVIGDLFNVVDIPAALLHQTTASPIHRTFSLSHHNQVTALGNLKS